MHGVALAFIIVSALSVVAGLFSRSPGNLLFYSAANGADAAADLLDHAPIPAMVAAAFAIGLFLLWLSRRRRKRSPKLIGAKSRALLAAVVARMRETLKPRPVLRPGGASA